MELGIDDFMNSISEEDKQIYTEIASLALELGYKPKKAKTKAINYVFTNNKTKKHILKFSIEKGAPILKMKFYASKDYSTLFLEGVRMVIEEFDYKYTGCYKCGKCSGTPLGYVYEYPDGRKYFRCGGELISLPPITKQDIPEILSLLNAQHEYYLSRL